MTRWLLAIVVFLLAHSALAVTFIPLRGEIEVKTFPDRRSGAVTVSANGSLVARFCLSFPQRLEQPINLKTIGEVVYLPQPIEGLPPGVRTSGPEPIAQTLTVIPEDSAPIAFLAEGVKPIVPGSQVILIRNVSREDQDASTNAAGCGPPS